MKQRLSMAPSSICEPDDIMKSSQITPCPMCAGACSLLIMLPLSKRQAPHICVWSPIRTFLIEPVFTIVAWCPMLPVAEEYFSAYLSVISFSRDISSGRWR